MEILTLSHCLFYWSGLYSKAFMTGDILHWKQVTVIPHNHIVIFSLAQFPRGILDDFMLRAYAEGSVDQFPSSLPAQQSQECPVTWFSSNTLSVLTVAQALESDGQNLSPISLLLWASHLTIIPLPSYVSIGDYDGGYLQKSVSWCQLTPVVLATREAEMRVTPGK
jgi:hypothetical protein